MPKTAQDVLNSARELPPEEQLRLAALILQELANAEIRVVAPSDSWSEQDQRDLAAFSLKYAERAYPEEEWPVEFLHR